MDLRRRFPRAGGRLPSVHPYHADAPVHDDDPAMTSRRFAHVLEDMEDEGSRTMDELF